ncbi:MAG: hypothetical protein K9N48_02260 [Verrucomicrobia bacterium]|nr:hypothetical protein [Verrucomicrobiota bacterium]MCF7708291.1 hypothetical protein [Verrucomicrobiota bacterium]
MKKHEENCPRCELFHQQHEQIARALTVYAPPIPDSIDHNVKSRVMTEIKSLHTPAPQRAFSPLTIATACACALIAISLILFSINSLTNAPTKPDASSLAAGNLTTKNLTTSDFPDELSFLKLSADIEKPLRKEIEKVVESAQSAVTLLAKNFVPAGSIFSISDNQPPQHQ